MTKRVWILGAGFSRSLGAPLLNDLLSFRLRHRLLQAGYLSAPGGHQDLVYALYHYGMGYPEGYAFGVESGSLLGERGLWAHAEEYLEFLDASAHSRSGCEELESVRLRCLKAAGTVPPSARKGLYYLLQACATPVLGDDAQEVAVEARRIIAAECCEFLRTPSKERLQPYVRWLRKLSGDDTIITFNYDCLVESLATEETRQILVSGVEDPTISYQNEEPPVLLKLHGSVDWRRGKGPLVPFERSGDPEFACKEPERGLLCTPGGSKLQATTELAPLWKGAREAIMDADRVHFVGYRIPESDAAAREMILGALGQCRRETHVKLVLGAAPHHDRGRLSALVSMAGVRVRDTGLWAQDFLEAWSPFHDHDA